MRLRLMPRRMGKSRSSNRSRGLLTAALVGLAALAILIVGGLMVVWPADEQGMLFALIKGDQAKIQEVQRLLEPEEPPAFVAKWGSHGTGDGQFISTEGVAVDSQGNVCVADRQSRRIQKFTLEGRFLARWGVYGTNRGQFREPRGVAVDSLGNVYVPDTQLHRIQKFDSRGNFITLWGRWGSANGQFRYPKGVAVDSRRNVYVTDSYGSIQKFDSQGTFIRKWAAAAWATASSALPSKWPWTARVTCMWWI